MITLTFLSPDGTRYQVEGQPGHSLMEAARDAGVPGIIAECGGSCSCSTCHVYLDPAWTDCVEPAEGYEKDMLEFAYEPDEALSRLSCQIRVTEALDGIVLRIPTRQGF